MKRAFDFGRFLTSAAGWEAIFLTLFFFFLQTSIVLAADDETASASPVTADQPADSPYDDIDKTHRTAMLWQYVRQQMPQWAPGLNQTLRAPLGWAHALGTDLGGDASADAGNNRYVPPVFEPLADVMQPPANDAQGMWLTPGYHHMGFLPFHDVMMAGMDLRRHMFGGGMHFDFKPYYGQNWTSLNGYGGARFDVALLRAGESQPWGRIGLGYTEGASYLMDRGHGFDLHAVLRFTDNLNLRAGVRDSQSSSDIGNYAIMRWKLLEFGN
jgi:hypothetical protein